MPHHVIKKSLNPPKKIFKNKWQNFNTWTFLQKNIDDCRESPSLVITKINKYGKYFLQ